MGTISETEAKLESKLREILKSNGISDPISSITIKSPGLKGEGFASVTKYVTVKFNNDETLALFVKLKSDNPSHNEMVNEMKAFEKEATFFRKYVPAANLLCTSKGYPELLDFYPKCYYGDDKTCILENLVIGKGYYTVDKETKQDLHFAKTSLTTLAKHHAVAHAMVQEAGGPEKFFQEFPDLNHEWFTGPVVMSLMENLFENALQTNALILEVNLGVKGAKEAAEKLRTLTGKSKELTTKAIERQDPEQFTVMGHGDYWNCNMMFRQESEKRLHTMLIDFQTTRYGSPALDLSYYLWMSVPLSVREPYLKELFTAYLEMLNQTSRQLGHPINLSYEDLLLQYRQRVAYGFWNGLLAVVGPGLKMFDDVDISKLETSEWTDVANRAMAKWMEENPEGSKEAAEELVRFIREYDQLYLE